MIPDHVILLDAGQLLGDARRLRSTKPEHLTEIQVQHLRRAARLCWAASHAAVDAARLLDHTAARLERQSAER